MAVQPEFNKLLDEEFSQFLSDAYLPAKARLKEMLGKGMTMEEISRDYSLVSDYWRKDNEVVGISAIVPNKEVKSFLAELGKQKA